MAQVPFPTPTFAPLNQAPGQQPFMPTTSGGGGGGGGGGAGGAEDLPRFGQAVVLGEKTTLSQPIPTPVPTPAPAPAPVQQGPTAEEILQKFIENVNQQYQPVFDYLNKQESMIKGQQPGIEQEINQAIGVNRQGLDVQRASGEQGLATAGDQAGQRKEDAFSAARRLFNELQRAGQQRFGGASSAGEAYSALADRELVRNQGDIQKGYEQAMQQIQVQKSNLDNTYSQALAQLDLQKTQLINQAQREFQNKLMEIERQRTELGGAKAADITNMNLQALQDLRNQIYQINLASAQSQAQLDAQAVKLNNELENVANNLSKYESSFNPTMNPSTGLGVNDSTPMSYNWTPTGKKDEELITGQYNPRLLDGSAFI